MLSFSRVPLTARQMLLLALPALSACGGDGPATAHDASVVDASTVDASTADASVPLDAATILDAAMILDAASEVDAHVAPDASAPDAGPPPPVSFYATGAIVAYVVPAGVTALRVVAEGASGGAAVNRTGASVCPGGRGARVETMIGVTPGESISVLVGQQPIVTPAGDDGCGASGGGGTFVVRGTTPIAVAGAGGGSSGYLSCRAGDDAMLIPDGGSFASDIRGGTGGMGGTAASGTGGGGGLLGDGGGAQGGRAFIHGGAGGMRAPGEGCTGDGGFGGGGGGDVDRGGGGGGYSGGSGIGSGGGSIATGTAPTITRREAEGDGLVVITPL